MADTYQASVIFFSIDQKIVSEIKENPLPINLIQKLKLRLQKQDKNKVTAALLALPLPLGFAGVHRIYLGTKPYMPFVYIGTLGGCFGILPFVDMMVILIDDDLEKYVDNPKVFMWGN